MKEISLGIEIGGTKLQLGVGDSVGNIFSLLETKVYPKEGAEGILHWLNTSIPKMIDQAQNEHYSIKAISVGFGGPIDSKNGIILKSNQVSGWDGFNLKKWIEDQFGFPVLIINDSNAATWAEYSLGHGRGTKHFFYTNIGSGIGGGLVINGSLYDGQGFGAAELGHTLTCDWTGNKPGGLEEIENLCSGWAIAKRMQNDGYIPESSILYRMIEGDTAKFEVRLLKEAAELGDAFVLNELDHVASSMAVGLVNVLCLLSVEVIAIGGGVSNLGECLLKPIRKHLCKYEIPSFRNRYKVVLSKLRDDIVLRGAILLAMHSLN